MEALLYKLPYFLLLIIIPSPGMVISIMDRMPLFFIRIVLTLVWVMI
ncbi:MAG: hypothetical protein ACOYIF_10280 [Acetivibrionales bacterium]|jgi:hypothetical protein